MSTSDRIVVVEAAGAAALVVGLSVWLSPQDLWLSDFGLHPMWLPIIVLSARYAARGLFPALVLTVGGLLVTSLALGGTMSEFAVRAGGTSDLLALAIAILVAWIAMAHESRISRCQRRLEEASEAQRHAEESVHALHASLGYLRNRHDRLDVSLSLWRSLSRRLERGNPHEATRAVLELCEIRAGARAGLVQLRDGARLSTLATRGNWPMNGGEDATIAGAISTRHVTPAAPGARESDSDVAIPVIDDDSSAVVGVIALRGVSPRAMRAADLRDLGVLAQWIAPAITRQLRREFGRALAALAASDLLPRSTMKKKSEVSL